eukprot:CAMPEP_0185845564 /NCGR_PEP_ID=MMETSP1354-20130828/1494_1 /TAXON_ID=708628 /ORGANISM="Erythrolobus madagascarensis, Strain CCMP3276" /LENGTH=537 /DNA_ID=CAMNT_0028545551 /DNA_START=435 /DNA_END=2048 /DNA_ORIENTATION=+
MATQGSPSANNHLSAASDVKLRYGDPISMSGELEKEGRRFHARKRRHFRLRDSALYNHRRKGSAPSWTLSVIDSRVESIEKTLEIRLILSDGKELRLLASDQEELANWCDALRRASVRKIGSHYGVTGIIGTGSFAEVRLGYDKVSGDNVAIKIMKKNKKDKELMKSVECELNFVQKRIIDQHVVQTYDVFNTKDNLFIVMEYMAGGMLYDILVAEGSFTEQKASRIMGDILSGIYMMHKNDMVHRDLKPENILCKNTEWPLEVKVADFGLADFVLENQFGDKCTRGMYGTPFFVAPEVIRGEAYGAAVDMWSCGVLLYNMLSGQLPFDGNNIRDVLKRVKQGTFTFPDKEWSEISDSVKDLICGLLTLDPKRRLTCEQALLHDWITSVETNPNTIIQNNRSELTSEARKTKMTSMAIDDVLDVLDLDDDDNIAEAVNGGSLSEAVSAAQNSVSAASKTSHTPPVSGNPPPTGKSVNTRSPKPAVHGNNTESRENSMFKFGQAVLFRSKKNRAPIDNSKNMKRRESAVSNLSDDVGQ